MNDIKILYYGHSYLKKQEEIIKNGEEEDTLI